MYAGQGAQMRRRMLEMDVSDAGKWRGRTRVEGYRPQPFVQLLRMAMTSQNELITTRSVPESDKTYQYPRN